MVNLLEHNGIQKFLYDNNLEVHFDIVKNEEKLPCMWRCWLYHSKLMHPHLMYDNGVMVGSCGRGNTTIEAFNDLCFKLSGRLIIFIDHEQRKEFFFPLIVHDVEEEKIKMIENNFHDKSIPITEFRFYREI